MCSTEAWGGDAHKGCVDEHQDEQERGGCVGDAEPNRRVDDKRENEEGVVDAAAFLKDGVEGQPAAAEAGDQPQAQFAGAVPPAPPGVAEQKQDRSQKNEGGGVGGIPHHHG
jgi:hypothetical protein